MSKCLHAKRTIIFWAIKHAPSLLDNIILTVMRQTQLRSGTGLKLLLSFNVPMSGLLLHFSASGFQTGICSRPPDADNSTQEGENVTEGSTVRYTCDFGYRFPKKFGGQPFVELVCSGHNWTFGNHSDSNNNQSLDLLHCERKNMNCIRRIDLVPLHLSCST